MDSGLSARGGAMEGFRQRFRKSREQQVPDQGGAHPTLQAGHQQPPRRAYRAHTEKKCCH